MNSRVKRARTARAVPARGRAARNPLTREGIIEAALGMIDADGLEALSMRRLGAELGVEGMALYHHFASKGELLDGVMERLLQEVKVPGPRAGGPLARLRRGIESYRGLAVRHPHAFPLMSQRRFNTDPAFEFYEGILALLAAAGLPPADAARYFRMLGYYANGAGLAEIASRALAADATPVRLEHGVDADRFPHLAAVAPHLRVAGLTRVFDAGLDVIFAAMEATIREHRPAA